MKEVTFRYLCSAFYEDFEICDVTHNYIYVEIVMKSGYIYRIPYKDFFELAQEVANGQTSIDEFVQIVNRNEASNIYDKRFAYIEIESIETINF